MLHGQHVGEVDLVKRLSGVALALLAAATLTSSVGARAQTVTLSVQRFFHQQTQLHQFHFSGAVSSGKSGEYVTVLIRKCGQSFETSVAGASTRENGLWGAGPSVPLQAGSGTYRARWKRDVSPPVTLRPPIGVEAERRRGGRVRVAVTAWEVAHNLSGRAVVLQRLRAGKWSDVRQAKLRRAAGGSYWPQYVATFTYRERGAVLRATVPANTVGKCFKPGATKKWTST